MYSSLSRRLARHSLQLLPRAYNIPWFHSGYDIELFNVIFPKYNFMKNTNIDLEVKIHTVYITLIYNCRLVWHSEIRSGNQVMQNVQALYISVKVYVMRKAMKSAIFRDVASRSLIFQQISYTAFILPG